MPKAVQVTLTQKGADSGPQYTIVEVYANGTYTVVQTNVTLVSGIPQIFNVSTDTTKIRIISQGVCQNSFDASIT